MVQPHIIGASVSEDDVYERQPGRAPRACTPIVREIAVVLAATFGIGSWSMSTYCMPVYMG